MGEFGGLVLALQLDEGVSHAVELQCFELVEGDLVGRGNVGGLPHPEITPQRPTPWLGISDTNFNVQRVDSSL
jgi:hypothetical protein